MKRLYVTHKWKQQNEHRKRYSAKKQVRSRKRTAVRVKSTQPGLLTTRVGLRDEWMSVPRDFSLLDNPAQVVRFMDDVDGRLCNPHLQVVLDFRRVERVTVDALLLLMSRLDCARRARRGNPAQITRIDRTEVLRVVNGSGFADLIAGFPVELVERKGQFIWEGKGLVTGREADGKLASDLVRFGMERMTGDRVPHGVSYARLVEAMANTFDHAHGVDVDVMVDLAERESWWACVFFDDVRNVLQFSVIDNGVGILRSLGVRATRSRLRFWQTRTDVDVLRGMLRGEFISRTKKVGRGRGISGVHRDFSAGRIENAVIVSNKVYANLRADRFQSLGRELRGTLIQWEIAR